MKPGVLASALALWPLAGAAECRLALALAIDVSSSVDAREDALQRGGIASALRAPEVRHAFLATPARVALAAYEWSGRYNQEVLVDWTMIDAAGDLDRVAQAISESRRSHDDFPTAMGHALGFGAGLIGRAPPCAAQTIDIAGDGQNNEGFGPAEAYAAFPFENVTVNGLVVRGTDAETQTGLIAFYRSQVIHGPAAFVEVADGFDDYARAMRRKLEREVAPPIIGSPGAGPRVRG